jgi:hypothetical protein
LPWSFKDIDYYNAAELIFRKIMVIIGGKLEKGMKDNNQQMNKKNALLCPGISSRRTEKRKTEK